MTISGHMLRMAAAANQGEPIPTEPGTPFGGGYYYGRINIDGKIYALVVAPKAIGEAPVALDLKTSNTATAGTGSRNDGWANTQAMVDAGISNHPAAQYCVNLTIGGYNDWYLWSQDEEEIAYRNLKPTTQANNTNSGANPSSVPPTSNYTSGNPAQTSIALFREGGAEAFRLDNSYRSSTEYDSSYAWRQGFGNGLQGSSLKNIAIYVRAIRRVLVP